MNTPLTPAIERKQLQITPKLLGLNIPLSRARINARSETKLSRDVATRIFRMVDQPRWYAYSSIKIGARYKDVAAIYHVSNPDLTDEEVLELIRDDIQEVPLLSHQPT
jgi:hypothetical protein